MSYNGSGTFNINTTGQPVVTGTVISSTAFNALTADLGTGLSTAITKNGQTTVTANIPFNGYKLTGIAVATASGDALSYGQAATVSTLTDSALTSGRVPYASTAGLFVDSANLTFNGTTLTAAGFSGPISGVVTSTSITDSGLTSGRVTFATTGGLLTDSANLTFNGTTLTTANDASIHGLTVGLGAGAVSTNTAVGASALAGNSTGINSVAVGYQALNANTGGYATAVGFQAGRLFTLNASESFGSTFVGVLSGQSTTTGYDNAFFGAYSGWGTTTGSFNTALGSGALKSNTTASNNTAVGYQAGYSNTTGVEQVAVGQGALYSNTTGNANTALGRYTLNANSTGQYNTAVGSNAMDGNTTGSDNVGIGRLSLRTNTTGASNVAIGSGALLSNTTASSNTAVGYQSGYSNTTGTANYFGGYQAGYSNSTNDNCVFLGYQTGYASTAGGNTFVGRIAGTAVTTGNQNSFYGYNSGYLVTTGSKNTIIGSYSGNQGSLDIRTSSNYIVLSDGDGNPRGIFDGSGNLLVGTTSSTPTGTNNSIIIRPGAASYFSASSTNSASFGRYTTTGTVVNIDYAGATIGTIATNGTLCTFNSVSDYRLKEDIAPMTGALNTVLALKPVTYKWKSTGEESQGFIAHELQEVVPQCVTGAKDAVDADGNPVYQGIDTSFLVATLTAAIQELKAEIDALKSKLGV